MPGIWRPNNEPLCLLECGCVADMFGAFRQVGEGKNGRKVWWQHCRATGEPSRVIAENVTWDGGGRCASHDRLF
jgi:hypothetical protein